MWKSNSVTVTIFTADWGLCSLLTGDNHQFIVINLFAIFSHQIADIYNAMAGHQKNRSSTSWWHIINRTILHKNIQWN